MRMQDLKYGNGPEDRNVTLTLGLQTVTNYLYVTQCYCLTGKMGIILFIANTAYYGMCIADNYSIALYYQY